ncbi:MAG TPA: hypothetical protein PLB32_19360, partial [Acidobacteriota bacterium]|nr:hypothetical protein [Acidobacteriota bacterium]
TALHTESGVKPPHSTQKAVSSHRTPHRKRCQATALHTESGVKPPHSTQKAASSRRTPQVTGPKMASFLRRNRV